MPLRGAASTGAAPANAHLKYYGGQVVANIKVVAVFWGAAVNSETKGSIPKFFSTLTTSPFFTWLNQYNTNVPGGTNQTIGAGSFAEAVTITPSANSAAIDDTAIQAELDAQITAGNLPAPDNNTVYMTYLPPGVGVTLSGLKSCVDFCAYHGAFSHATGSANYAVIPDLSANGCNTGCGGAVSPFGNLTSVSSHELIETVTDPKVSLAPTIAAPIAWYDATNNAEIGDLCNQLQGTITATDGTLYTVQQEYSNLDNACIVSRPTSAAPTLTSPAPGSSLSGSSAAFTWTAGVGYDTYYLNAGSVVDGTNYFSQALGTNKSATISGLPTDGSTVFVRLWYGTLSGTTAIWGGYTDFKFTAAAPALHAPSLTSPAPSSTLAGPAASMTWAGGSGYNAYWLYAGNTTGSSSYYSRSAGSALSALVTGLPTNGSTVYVRLWYGTSSGSATRWAGFIDYTFKAASLTPPALLSPAPNATLPSSTATFAWSAGHGYNTFVINGGSSVNSSSYFDHWVGNALSTTVTGLPTDGSKIYVRLWYGTVVGSTTTWSGHIDYVFAAQ